MTKELTPEVIMDIADRRLDIDQRSLMSQVWVKHPELVAELFAIGPQGFKTEDDVVAHLLQLTQKIKDMGQA
jgi:hypothetical protein